MTDTNLRVVLTAQDRTAGVFTRLRGEMAAIQSSAGALRAGFASMLGPLAAGVGVAGIVSLGRGVVNSIDSLNDLKDATGASIEKLSGLEDVAVRTGSSVEAAGEAVVKLNLALNAASNPDSDAARAFRALGLSVQQLKAQDPVEALRSVARALSGFADDGNKGRIVTELLGKSTARLAPLLAELAQAGELNAKVTSEQAAQAEAFNKHLAELGKNSSDAARRLTSELLPALNDILRAFRDGGLRAALDEFGEKIGFGRVYYGQRNLRILGEEIAALEQRLAGSAFLLAGGAPGERATLDEKKRRYAELARTLAVTEAAQRALADASNPANYGNEGRRGALPSLPDTLFGGGKDGKSGKKPFDVGEWLTDVQRTMDKSFAELNADAAVRDAQMQEKRKADAQQFMDDLLDQNARASVELLEDERQRGQALIALDTQVTLRRIENLGVYGDEYTRLRDQVLAGEQLALSKLDAQLAKSKDTAKDVSADIGLLFASAAGKAITEWTNFRGLLKGVGQDLLQILVKTSITDPLSKLFSDTAKGFDIGSLLLSVFAGGRAAGGPVQAGRLYRVNEGSGPGEMLNVGGQQYLMAKRSGFVSPGGGVNLTSAPTIYIDSRADAAQVAQMVAQGVQAGNQQLLAGLRAAGVMA